MSLDNYSNDDLLAEIERRKVAAAGKISESKYATFREINGSPVGLWEVKTEGDCEGRTRRTLGVFKGHILDIAAMLAPEAYYDLNFKKIDGLYREVKQIKENVNPNICFDINTGFWDLSLDERVSLANRYFTEERSNFDYGFTVNTEGCPYAGVKVKIFNEA